MRFVFLLLVLAGCSKDMTSDEYAREKAKQNLAKYDAVSGTYSGLVTSKRDGHVIGAMELRLTADYQTSNGTNGDPTGAQPVLVGNIRFLDKNFIYLSAPVGYYDSGTGVYHAEIPIAESTGGSSNSIVTISGNLRGGTLSGSVQAQQYPDEGANLQLTRGSESIESLLKKARGEGGSIHGGGRELRAYSGTTTFKTTSKPVHILILRPPTGTAQDFLYLICPVCGVQVSLNYGESLHLLFPNAVFDSRQGHLSGQASVQIAGVGSNPSQTQTLVLDCNIRDDDIDCNHMSTGNGIIARSTGTYDHTTKADPPDTPGERESVTKTFVGAGYFTKYDCREMRLQVTRPVRDRLTDLLLLFFPNSELTVNVSVLFSAYADDPAANFLNAKWDSQNGLLEGISSGANGDYTMQVQCHDFFFPAGSKPFSCTYWTSRSPSITIDFAPPFTALNDGSNTHKWRQPTCKQR